VLSNIDSPKFDFETLDYDDCTEILKSESRGHDSLSKIIYLFESTSLIPAKLLSLLELDRELLESKIDMLIDSFRQYRAEKTLIEGIKHNA
jgi:hypothetical protein